MEFWGKEERKNIYIQMGLGSIMSRKLYFGLLSRSALDSIHQNHLGREGLRWNDGQLMTCYTK